MSSKARDDFRQKEREIPEILVDPTSRRRYARGRFLGKGGFAKCYELTDMETNEVYAGKIVSKGLLVKQHQKEKMSQEIAIHRSLNHRHIVGFCSFFEDADNVYIVLELCRRRSLMELHKRRKAISEPEARYFLRHILLACKYLHENKVIHRDLKLGNLFMNDEMEVKIGDFGLATKVDFDGERKRTLCGTPNYIAPEVLSKKGHSYEVDVWSLGCILYTLLVGKPPFETSSLKDTYSRIKKNDYQVPPRVTPAAKNLIQRLLQAEPMKRPSMDAVLNDEFLTSGYLPTRLPTSCLTMAPRFDHKNDLSLLIARKPLLELNSKESNSMNSAGKKGAGIPNKLSTVPEGAILNDEQRAEEAAKGQAIKLNDDEPDDCYLSDLAEQLNRVLATKPAESHPVVQEEEIEDPAAMPMLWVSKWVDYSDKYGLGYQLCDNSVGVVFNDATKLILQADGENIHYIERNGLEHYHTLKQFPEALNKKVTLLRYFRNYMNEHLLKAGASMTPRDGDDLSRLPCLRTWFRTRSAIVLHLSNGTLQINFFQDHTKIIVCPLMSAVTYINEKRESRTYRFGLIEKYGCGRELASRMRYAKTMVERLTAAKPSSTKPKTAST